MSEAEQIADTLEAAADALWMYGRTTGAGVDDRGRMCVRGAIQHALGNDPMAVMGYVGLARTVSDALSRFLASHPDALGVGCALAHPDWAAGEKYPEWVWNDRTDDDDHVIDSLRRCAKEVRANA